jgi:hypothetical protein
MGQLDWLAGRQGRALGWFGRAFDEAERLRMRPEAARIRLEVARRLLEAGNAGAAFRGCDVRTLVGDARREFATLDLPWDLARLEVVLSGVRGRSLAADLR